MAVAVILPDDEMAGDVGVGLIVCAAGLVFDFTVVVVFVFVLAGATGVITFLDAGAFEAVETERDCRDADVRVVLLETSTVRLTGLERRTVFCCGTACWRLEVVDLDCAGAACLDRVG